MGKDLEQAKHSQLFAVPPVIHAGGLHTLAPDANKYCSRVMFTEFAYQCSAQLIS